MTKIKICGLFREEDILMVNKYKPDYVGFVFTKSSRQLTTPIAKSLREKLDKDIEVVGVFVNAEFEDIIQLVQNRIIDIVQLHGDETEQYITQLRASISCPIINAVRVKTREDILKAERLSCDYILLDAYSKGQYGGCGMAFDHGVIPKLSKPFFLAGGLNIMNIKNAILCSRPYAVDISSGVETQGIKDETKINELISFVRLIDIERKVI